MKGICFKEPLFNAIIEGRKTLTMRTGDLKKINKNPNNWGFQYTLEGSEKAKTKLVFKRKFKAISNKLVPIIPPRYQPNELVYLKEPYCIPVRKQKHFPKNINPSTTGRIRYAFSLPTTERKMFLPDTCWQNKLFMPEKHARYFIWIKAVNAKRCNNLTEEEIYQEGMSRHKFTIPPFHESDKKILDNINDVRASWKNLWTKINGEKSWKKNEWAIQYEFICGTLSSKGKDFKGDRLREDTQNISQQKVVYKNSVFDVGNRMNSELELYIHKTFIASVPFSEIQLFKQLGK